jgi:hypothetical protein
MIAKTIFDFFKRLTRDYFSNEYYYYFVVKIPPHTTQSKVSEKLTNFYQVSSHSQTRQRRKKKGKANCNFVIFKDVCVIVATEGEHDNLRRRDFKDIRKKSLVILGHEIKPLFDKNQKKLKITVIIPEYRYKLFTRRLERIALHNQDKVMNYLKNLSPYTFQGIQKQRFESLAMVNKKRKKAGLKLIKWSETKPFWAD